MLEEKNPREVKEIIDNDSNIVILDVREKWEYDICHLDNSTHIPMGQLLERIEELDKTLKHVVVCHHGIRSRMVAKHLISIGFEKVINLSTGVEGWANDVDSTMSKYA